MHDHVHASAPHAHIAAFVGVVALAAVALAQQPDGGTALPAGKTYTQPYPDDAVNLLPNGDFEQVNEQGDGPHHWQAIDNLVYHWAEDPAAPERGRVIRINTDVYQQQAYAWWARRYVQGLPLDQAPARRPTSGNKYDTIAGLDGGFYWSDPIPVKPGGAYRVYVDAKGPKAKVFIRGYVREPQISFGDEAPAVQQVFRRARGEPETDENGRPIRYRLRYTYTTWFAVGGSDEWTTYTHLQPRHPNNREITENVRWIRIMLYPYWPPGTYWFDNVRVVEVEAAEHGNIRPLVGDDEADIEEGKTIR
jgi:hypothetical protein